MGQAEIDQYRALHRQEWIFSGQSTIPHGRAIAALVQSHRARTLLDYGCGKARHYSQVKLHEIWGGVLPTLYDPGVEAFAAKPAPETLFDGVICCDVAEHIPPEEVEAFLRELIGYARKFVFMTISTVHASKRLPDRRNVHLTVQPAKWWNAELERAGAELSRARGFAPEITARFMQ